MHLIKLMCALVACALFAVATWIAKGSCLPPTGCTAPVTVIGSPMTVISRFALRRLRPTIRDQRQMPPG